ncbi:uncharacterized protein LOC126685861 [Mercurialis annua]|uniref:uncharacterized protein LOC126685861 n=1 Tax=Mercurialis annua TaxID=3986 RepID=UPI00216053E5|nr:uncharacterized protein LOC126685861 [Mercurialis annua]
MALSLSCTMLIIYFSVFVLAGDAMREMPEGDAMREMPEKVSMLENENFVRKATLMSDSGKITWAGTCSQKTASWLKGINSPFPTIGIQVIGDSPIGCFDVYQFKAGRETMFTIELSAGPGPGHTSEFSFHVTDEQRREISENGVGVYYLKKNAVTKDDKNEHNLLKQVVETI